MKSRNKPCPYNHSYFHISTLPPLVQWGGNTSAMLKTPGLGHLLFIEISSFEGNKQVPHFNPSLITEIEMVTC